MINNQFGRRNLSNYQRSVLALQLEEVFSSKAKEQQGKRTDIKQNSAESKPIETRKELAKVANVSHDTIAKVKKIEAVATPEVKAQLSTGEISINQAYQEIKKEEKKAERIELIEQQIEDIEQGLLPELKGLFDVVSVDPPWPYEGESKNVTSFDAVGRRVANPYPEMSIEQIKKIEMPLMNDSVVLLWTTHKFLPDAFEILKEWNLEYKATLVWNKEKIGMGAWFRMQCEFCLVGIKGKPYWNNTTFRDILNEPRRDHSRKPDGFFEMIEQITLGRRLEYFSREKRNGWEVFGNDINKF
jgi:N6-adenosine-specific RNA methylase IME4